MDALQSLVSGTGLEMGIITESKSDPRLLQNLSKLELSHTMSFSLAPLSCSLLSTLLPLPVPC